MTKIYVIGIGYKPFDKRASEIVLNSKILLASARLRDVFARYDEYNAVRERVKVINSIDETLSFMKASLQNEENTPLTLLASGDPMFFGIGRRAAEEIGEDIVEIIPDLSSMQLAFARIGKPWDDALLISLHGGPDPKRRRRLEYGLNDLPRLISVHKKIAVLTDRINNPAVIAKALLDPVGHSRQAEQYVKLFVCEKLGYPDERVSAGTAAEISVLTFSDPNVVIIINSREEGKSASVEVGASTDASGAGFGLTEEEIFHSRGLITKDEVRAVTIHKLRLPQTGTFWDIGAGSGSVSIEAARLQPGLTVFAVEKDEEQIRNMSENIIKFQVPNVGIINGTAPEALTDLPSPSRIFIGGSGGNIREIIEVAGKKMKYGIVVINATTVETFSAAAENLKQAGYSVEVSQVSVSRMKPLGEGHFFAAQNPVFVIKGIRKA